jgi:hypothetical protein
MTYIVVSFFAVAALADEIDAEIIKHLEFFEKMPVIEDLDLIEMEEQARSPTEMAAGQPGGPQSANDKDSLDDVVTGKGGGQ